ncbi:MAG: PTS-dependent dihydroxyacetone kinase phosphotransferase subunit DhaM [Caldilineaceae bacterium]|nr:PTS-dependent dihydroxyacetone kinase phosphotransferase subunit DhaM [Caldilineaceae bacterium]
MVNLVIVSHSARLAEGVKELAGSMIDGDVTIIAVGGIAEGDDYRLGTDPMRIHAALEEVWSEAGVLLLVDLGSAVLSATLALDFLTPEQRATCLISNAPLVEGAVIAALEAGLGHSLEEVNQAAEATAQFEKIPRSLNSY